MANNFPPPTYPAPIEHVDAIGSIGARIRWLRTRLGVTQAQLAKDLNADFALVSKWEANTHKPSEKYQARLALYFGVERRLFETGD